MSETRLPSARAAFVAGVITAAVLATACTSSDPTPPTTTTSGSTIPSTGTSAITSVPAAGTSTPTVDADLHNAIEAFWQMYVAVGGNKDAFDAAATRAAIQTRATGAEVDQLFQFFQGNAVSGLFVQGGVAIAPTVVSVDGDTATVRDCVDDTTGVYRISDGTRTDADDPARHQMLLTLRREDGVWKVAAIKDEGSGCTA